MQNNFKGTGESSVYMPRSCKVPQGAKFNMHWLVSKHHRWLHIIVTSNKVRLTRLLAKLNKGLHLQPVQPLATSASKGWNLPPLPPRLMEDGL